MQSICVQRLFGILCATVDLPCERWVLIPALLSIIVFLMRQTGKLDRPQAPPWAEYAPGLEPFAIPHALEMQACLYQGQKALKL